MSKHIDTLVADMYDVLENDKNHSLETEAITRFAASVAGHYQNAVSGVRRPRKDNVIYASELGKKCIRQLAYERTPGVEKEPIRGATLYKFLYGNVIEELTLQLVKSAGHKVTHEQAEFEYVFKVPDTLASTEEWKVRGRSDCVIDDEAMVDIKSASAFAFRKYTSQGIDKDNDSFGYIEQLDFYDTLWENTAKVTPNFLFVNKESGALGLVSSPYSASWKTRATTIAKTLSFFNAHSKYPERMEGYEVPEGKSGNMKLSTVCSYCPFKKTCHPTVRTFLYANQPVFLTKVVREPKVPEVK